MPIMGSTTVRNETVYGYGTRTIWETDLGGGDFMVRTKQPMLTMWRMDHDGCEQVYEISERREHRTTEAERREMSRRYDLAIRFLSGRDGGYHITHQIEATCMSNDDELVLLDQVDGGVFLFMDPNGVARGGER